jgi:hypothetical protein
MASATCDTTQRSLATATPSNTVASFSLAAVSGCSLSIDQVSVSLYAGSTPYTVYLTGFSGTSCSTYVTLLDNFPIFPNTSVTRFFNNGGLNVDSVNGPKFCVYFNGSATGQSEYITIPYHLH